MPLSANLVPSRLLAVGTPGVPWEECARVLGRFSAATAGRLSASPFLSSRRRPCSPLPSASVIPDEGFSLRRDLRFACPPSTADDCSTPSPHIVKSLL